MLLGYNCKDGKMSTSKIVLSLFCAAALSACSTAKSDEWFISHNGNMPSEERIAQIKQGNSQEDIIRVLGAPSAVVSFDANTWLYMSSDIKRVAFLEPEEVDRKVLKITFNNNGKVAQIVRLSKEDGKNITPSEDKTEVRGQDPGFFRKYFGGVGQYNPFAGQSTPGL